MAVRAPRRLLLRTRVDTTQIVPASKLVSTITGYPVQPNKAIVGANAFAHESGIHQDGVLKHRETYEIMRAEDVGWKANRLTLGKLSGRNAFKTKLAELGIVLDGEEALNTAFARFEPADKKRDLRRRPAGIGLDGAARPSTSARLVSMKVCPGRRGAARADGVYRRRCREAGQRRRLRSGRRHLQGARVGGQQRRQPAALLGQQHHQRHRCAGRGDRAAGA
jgi:2-isopropylmalate synthase